MKILEQLFAVLADGYFHSGEHLSQQLDVSRSSIWNGIEKLKAMGLDLGRRRDRGNVEVLQADAEAAEIILQAFLQAFRELVISSREVKEAVQVPTEVVVKA